MIYIKKIGARAKKSFEKLKKVDHKIIKKVLEDYNKKLRDNKFLIIKNNQRDVKNVIRKSLVDRLVLNDDRLDAIRSSINQIAKFENPVGKTLAKWKQPNKLLIKRVTTPIGVIGVIYESRPNVTADVAALCLKSGNCAILRGGSEAFYSNKILSDLFRESLRSKNIDQNCVQFIEKKNRSIVDYMLSSMNNYIDVIVPRGGKGLVKKVQEISKVHVIGHLEGLCHAYVEKSSNIQMAKSLVLNSKMRRTSICGALETLLIQESAIQSHGIPIIQALIRRGCEVRVDKKINKIFKGKLKSANNKDWSTEYLDKILSVKSVANVKEAVQHILKYGTMHTDSIITKNQSSSDYFLKNVNSSIAMHNVSTQFADGGEFGFGGEIGISTNKLPPRGPVGINQLTSYKYEVHGKGIIRS